MKFLVNIIKAIPVNYQQQNLYSIYLLSLLLKWLRKDQKPVCPGENERGHS